MDLFRVCPHCGTKVEFVKHVFLMRGVQGVLILDIMLLLSVSIAGELFLGR
ncbi:hypothetical protein ES703_45943 [subsurface metagenome]